MRSDGLHLHLQGYSELRGIRSGMEETATTARREVGRWRCTVQVRECTAEGKEKVRFLREEEVTPPPPPASS